MGLSAPYLWNQMPLDPQLHPNSEDQACLKDFNIPIWQEVV